MVSYLWGYVRWCGGHGTTREGWGSVLSGGQEPPTRSFLSVSCMSIWYELLMLASDSFLYCVIWTNKQLYLRSQVDHSHGDKTGAHGPHPGPSWGSASWSSLGPVWTLPRCPNLGCHLAEAVTNVLRAGPWAGEAAHRLMTLDMRHLPSRPDIPLWLSGDRSLLCPGKCGPGLVLNHLFHPS